MSKVENQGLKVYNDNNQLCIDSNYSNLELKRVVKFGDLPLRERDSNFVVRNLTLQSGELLVAREVIHRQYIQVTLMGARLTMPLILLIVRMPMKSVPTAIALALTIPRRNMPSQTQKVMQTSLDFLFLALRTSPKEIPEMLDLRYTTRVGKLFTIVTKNICGSSGWCLNRFFHHLMTYLIPSMLWLNHV